MLKNKITAALFIVLAASFSANAAECKPCTQLTKMGTDFSKLADSERSLRGSKARGKQELKQAAALNAGAEVAIKILEDKNLDDEKLETVALYLAITAEHDGLYLVMESIVAELKKSEAQVISKLRTALVHLKAKKQISDREYELVESSISIVLNPNEA